MERGTWNVERGTQQPVGAGLVPARWTGDHQGRSYDLQSPLPSVERGTWNVERGTQQPVGAGLVPARWTGDHQESPLHS